MAERQPENETPRETANLGLQENEDELRDPAQRHSPRRSAQQDAPEAERPTSPDEDAEQDIANLENPPQAEGPRERSNNAV